MEKINYHKEALERTKIKQINLGMEEIPEEPKNKFCIKVWVAKNGKLSSGLPKESQRRF